MKSGANAPRDEPLEPYHEVLPLSSNLSSTPAIPVHTLNQVALLAPYYEHLEAYSQAVGKPILSLLQEFIEGLELPDTVDAATANPFYPATNGCSITSVRFSLSCPCRLPKTQNR